MTEEILIRRERPDHPQVQPLLAALDAYLASLYAPEDNHILDVQALAGAGGPTSFAAWRPATGRAAAPLRRMAAGEATGGQPYGEIKRMFVGPEARGRRIGARLI
jgi:putative acetyltransferase